MRWSRLQRMLVALIAVVLCLVAVASLFSQPAGAQETDEGTAPALEVVSITRDESTGLVQVEVIAPVALAGDRVPKESISVQLGNVFIPFEYTATSAEQLEVVLVLDVSGSMEGAALQAAKDAANGFVDRLPQTVRVGVVAFDGEARMVAKVGTPAADIEEQINALTVGGETALFDALLRAEDLFNDEITNRRRVIVALTDGADSASAATADEVSAQFKGNLELYGIGLQTSETNTADLERLSIETGGTFSTSSTTALIPLYEELATQLSSRFVVVFDPKSSASDQALVILSHQGTVAAATAPYTAVDAVAIAAQAPKPELSVIEKSTYTAPVSYEIAAGGFFASKQVRNAGLVAVTSTLFLFGLLAAFPSQRMTLLAQSGKDRAANVGVSNLTTRLEGMADRKLSVDRRQRLSKALERAGLDLRASEFLVLVGAIAIALAMMFLLLGGLIPAIIVFGATFLVARLYVRRKGQKRSDAFVEQLPQTLQLIAGALRAGYALPQAAETVAAETQAPTSDEFHRLVTEHRLGRDFSDALNAMDARIQSQDFSWVVQAFEIHRQVGGDLAEVLENVIRTMRDRSFIRRQFAALSAEGRYSAYLIVGLPIFVVIALSITNPTYIGGLIDGPRGYFATALALTLMAIGSFWMKVLMKVKF